MWDTVQEQWGQGSDEHLSHDPVPTVEEQCVELLLSHVPELGPHPPEDVDGSDGDVERVVEVLEALRGCTMDGAMIGEEVPSECALWQASVSDGG